MAKKALILLLSSAIAVFAASVSVFAESTPEFSMNLPNLTEDGGAVFDIVPGSDVTGTLTLRNMDKERTISLKMSAEQGPDTSFTVLPSEWLKFGTESVTLAPSESLTMDFTISVPAGTSIDSYKGLIKATMVEYFGEATEESSLSKVAVQFATATKVIVNVVADDGAVAVSGEEGDAASSGDSSILRFLKDNYLIILAFVVIIVGLVVFSQKRNNNGKKGKK